jgi:signal transduction histidine kinase
MSEKSLFETVLASSVHDMKNSLGLLMGELDNISLQLEQDTENQRGVSTIRYETSRINDSLIQLLSLYKLENNQLDIQVIEVDVVDFIEDCIASCMPLAANNGVQLAIDCDDATVWFFDPDMVSIVLNNIIGNSIRYAKKQVLISVKIEDGRLLIQVDDDGEGYPESMLQDPESFSKKVNSSTGSTGLGLFFSNTVAYYHKRCGKQGEIKLGNGHLLRGGCFQMYLP